MHFLPVTNISTFIRLQKATFIAAFFQTADRKVFDHITPIEIRKEKGYQEEKITSFCLPWKPPCV